MPDAERSRVFLAWIISALKSTGYLYKVFFQTVFESLTIYCTRL
jgi:hypothetical protein